MKYTNTYSFPFKGPWLTFWGGDTPELNHHHQNVLQRYAYDFIKVDEAGNFYRSYGATNEDYYSFGQPVLAPAGGTVIGAVDGIRDNIPRDTNTYSVLGNYIFIQHAADEFSLIAHLKKHSLKVEEGDKVARGDELAECGNSGNSSDPHIHYHVQNSSIFNHLTDDYEENTIAEGLKVLFQDVDISNSNGSTFHKLYSPIKEDIVSSVYSMS